MTATQGAGTGEDTKTIMTGNESPNEVDREPPAGTARSGNGIARWVFWPAASIIVVFAAFAILFPGTATEMFTSVQANVIRWFGWYYVAAIAIFVGQIHSFPFILG